MTVKELKAHLDTLNQNAEIVLWRYMNGQSMYKPIGGTIAENNSPFNRKYNVVLLSAEPIFFTEQECNFPRKIKRRKA